MDDTRPRSSAAGRHAPSAARRRRAPAGPALAGLALAALAFGAVAALEAAPAAAAGPAGEDLRPGQRAVSGDTMALATGPYSRMNTLLEKTIFQVNVAELTLRYDSATAARIREAAAGSGYSERVADSVAAAVVGAERVHGHLEFRRDVGLGRFMESLRTNMRKARDAGILADSAYRRFRGRVPDWYAALEGRGVREGDVTEYRIRGDSLQVLFRSAGGEVLIDRHDVGRQHVLAVLGGYLAPGADFREGLVRSLFREE